MTDGDRLTRPLTPKQPGGDDDSGPKAPSINRPDGGNELLRRLKKVDPDQAKRYRQRSGQ
jgi:hypothetical protein